MATVRVRL